ncbi:Hypothetical predicted protein, partial [Paramuricea clavata]
MEIADGYSNNKFVFRCLADTGSERTLISEDLLLKHEFVINPAADPHLVAANNHPLKCNGRAHVTLASKGRKTIETAAIVCSDLKQEVILGRPILRRLHIIPKGFPNIIAKVMTFEEELKREFPETLSDKLPEIAMKGEAMKIHLCPDADIIPTRRLTARQVPLARQEAAEEVVEKLLRDKIIQRVDWPTDWISPGFFVPKADGKSVR